MALDEVALTVSYIRTGTPLADRQRKATSPTTGESIRSWVAEQASKGDITHREEVVRTGQEAFPDFYLHSIQLETPDEDGQGDPSYLELFYVFGGGFINPIDRAGHLPMVLALARNLGSRQIHLPECSLAPQYPYPCAHVQIVEALRAVLRRTVPDKLVLAGDSAGASLIAGALAHLITPSPYTLPLDISSPLRAVLLICPYIIFYPPDSPTPISFRENARIDYETRAYDLAIQHFYAPVHGEVYAELRRASIGFWKGLKGKVERIDVIAGEWEMLRDDIVTFGHRLRDEGLGTEVAVHVVDMAIGIEDGAMLGVLARVCRSMRS